MIILKRFFATASSQLQQQARKLKSIPSSYTSLYFKYHSGIQCLKKSFNVKAIKPVADMPSDPSDIYVTIITGKKAVSSLAVYRRRATRRLRTALQEEFATKAPSSHVYLFYSREDLVTVPWNDLLAQVRETTEELNTKIRRSLKAQKSSKTKSYDEKRSYENDQTKRHNVKKRLQEYKPYKQEPYVPHRKEPSEKMAYKKADPQREIGQRRSSFRKSNWTQSSPLREKKATEEKEQ